MPSLGLERGPGGSCPPVYYQWDFMTGIDEDFESLVNLLVPQTHGPQRGHPGHGLLARFRDL